jgi:hypothetical protein
MGNFDEEGAFAPIAGAGDAVTAVGLIHEPNSCWNVIVSKTLSKL